MHHQALAGKDRRVGVLSVQAGTEVAMSQTVFEFVQKGYSARLKRLEELGAPTVLIERAREVAKVPPGQSFGTFFEVARCFT